jgi:hypothetical protein
MAMYVLHRHPSWPETSRCRSGGPWWSHPLKSMGGHCGELEVGLGWNLGGQTGGWCRCAWCSCVVSFLSLFLDKERAPGVLVSPDTRHYELDHPRRVGRLSDVSSKLTMVYVMDCELIRVSLCVCVVQFDVRWTGSTRSTGYLYRMVECKEQVLQDPVIAARDRLHQWARPAPDLGHDVS